MCKWLTKNDTLLRRSKKLAKKKTKEKDVIDRMLDKIDFQGMTAEQISRKKRFAQVADKPFLFESFGSRKERTFRLQEKRQCRR